MLVDGQNYTPRIKATGLCLLVLIKDFLEIFCLRTILKAFQEIDFVSHAQSGRLKPV